MGAVHWRVTRWIAAALALALSACAGETRFVAPEGQDDGWLREAVAAQWAAAGVTVPADYPILFLDAETLLDACEAPRPKVGMIGGCNPHGSDAILIWEGADTDLQVSVAVHELGHVLRGDARHLDCPEVGPEMAPGQDMMCVTRAPLGTLPTARDAAFVSR